MMFGYDHALLPAMMLYVGTWSRSSQSTWLLLQVLGIGSIGGMWPSFSSMKFNGGGVGEISGKRYPFSVRFLSYENIVCSSHKDLTEGLVKNDGWKEKSKVEGQTSNAWVYFCESSSSRILILPQALYLPKFHLPDMPKTTIISIPQGFHSDNIKYLLQYLAQSRYLGGDDV